MARRKVVAVRWDKRLKLWVARPHTRFSGRPFAGWRLKAEAVMEAASLLRNNWEVGDQLGQLRVYGKSGRIQFERTYGKDPKRFAG